jgi:hypothetical protein
MDNIKKSELLELKTKLIKDIRDWKPSGSDAPDCFTMLYDYDEAVKKLNIDDVSNQRELLIAYQEYLNEANESYLHEHEQVIDEYLSNL